MSVAETANLADGTVGDRLTRWVGKPVFWMAFVLVLALLPIIRTFTIHLPPPLPVVSTVPDFQLTDETGAAFGSNNLRGRIWVADVIFTRCPTACPLITERMRKIQHRVHNLGSAIHLVSFSADPEYDTPARLHEYAEKTRASPRLWSFLTGPLPEIQRVVVSALKVSLEREGRLEDIGGILHDNHFILVDGQMRVRGYYDSSSEESVERLIRDVGLIGNRGG